MKILFIIFSFILLATYLNSTIINIPADQSTIQAGIDASTNTDTVLVQPGTYVEDINYNGKLIIVSSLFLTTADTSYISSTIIDGDDDVTVVNFSSGEDSTAVLIGFTITKGHGEFGNAGGIHIFNSSPSLSDLIISGNSASSGGGINCNFSNSIIENVTISSNTAVYGGAIYCENSNPSLNEVIVSNNSAESGGGGIYCSYNTTLSLVNVTIIENSSRHGGGMNCEGSSVSLENVTISGNNATYFGGGIDCEISSSLSFDPINRCNIFLNTAGSGHDLHATNCNTIDVIVDTFTVLHPDNSFAYPLDDFTFDIHNNKIEQIDQDLYVSPAGSNSNDGLTSDNPLLSISYALYYIIADSLDTHSIHLAPGTYSSSLTDEIFPLNCKNYISLLGEDEVTTILDGEDQSGIILCANANSFSIENMTIRNGLSFIGRGSGIYCYDYSSPSLNNVTISDNYANYGGGGIFCDNYSSPTLENITIFGNTSNNKGGGMFCRDYSSPNLYNVTISDNSANSGGGGICCDNYSNPNLENITIVRNTVNYGEGGGIYCKNDANPVVRNSILWNSSPDEIYIESSSITVIYSDIQGGWPGIGNTDHDPLFIDSYNDNFNLLYNSPCINTGDPSSPIDPDGTRADMGAFYFDHTFGSAEITDIVDIPNDQGRSVIVTWQRSIWDEEFSIVPITSYGLWEMYPFELDSECRITYNISEAIEKKDFYFNREDTTWVYIANVPAMQWDEYSAHAVTFLDSTATGDYWSYFFVSAHTPRPSLYFTSSIVSGYSVDNIAPDETEVLITKNGSNISISWQEVEYGTFQGNSYPEVNGIWYKIYAGDTSDFICDEIYLIDTVTNLDYNYPFGVAEKKFFKIVVSDQP